MQINTTAPSASTNVLCMVIKADGSVVIGSEPSAGNKLYVNGNLHCTGTIIGTFSPGNDLTITGKVTAGSATINGPLTVTGATGNATITNGELTASKVTVGSATISSNGEVAASKVTVGSATISSNGEVQARIKLPLPTDLTIADTTLPQVFVCAYKKGDAKAEVYARGKSQFPTDTATEITVNLLQEGFFGFPVITQETGTIQLTPIFENNKVFSLLAAQIINNNSFKVLRPTPASGQQPCNNFYYEVKAILT